MRKSLPDEEMKVVAAARQRLAAGEMAVARQLFLSLLEQTTAGAQGHAIPRVSALAGLIELEAKSKHLKTVEQFLQSLKQELAQLTQSRLSADVLDQLASVLNTLCETLGTFRCWSPVKQVSRLVVRYISDQSSPSQSHRIRALNNLGSALLAEGRYDDAVHIWQCTIKDYAHKTVDNSPAPLATIHNNLAELSRLQCRIPAACDHHRLALKMRLNHSPPEVVLIRQSRINLAQVLIEAWEFAAALEQIEAYLQTELPLCEQVQRENDRAQLLQVRCLLELGRLISADALLQQIARTFSKSESKTARQDVECHLLRLELAILFQRQNLISSETERLPALLQENQLSDSVLEGRYQLLLGTLSAQQMNSPVDSREAHLQHALRIFRKRLPRNHPWTAAAIFQLAHLFAETQRGQRAVQTANSAMAMLEQTFGERSLPMLHSLVELGQVVLTRGQFKTVRQLMKLAVQIKKEQPSVPPVTEMQVYDLLSRSYQGLQKPKLAAYYARATWRFLSTQLEYPPALEAPFVERALEWSHRAGQDQQAIPLALRKVELLRQEYHAQHPLVYRAQEDLGRLYAQIGQPDSAAQILSEILTVRCSELGEESPAAIELMELTASLHRQAGQHAAADALDEQLQAISQKSSHVLSDLL